TFLRPFRKLPILLVGDVPELNGILGIEARLADFTGMEMPLANDLGSVHSLGPDGERKHVVRVKVQEEVGQQAVIINMALVFSAKPGQAATLRRTIDGHRPDAFAKVHSSA